MPLRKVFHFFRHPWSDQVLFVPVWLMLGLARLLIVIVHFRNLAPILGRDTGTLGWLPLLSPRGESRARMVGRVVRFAARYTPWESNCFPQAIVARWLLGFFRVPYALCFGLARNPDIGSMQAHAWVAAGRVRVTGGEGFGHYAVVGCFVAPLAGCTGSRCSP